MTASQNVPDPSLDASQRSAAIGSATMTLRNVVTIPSDRAVAALSFARRARRDRSVAATLDMRYPVTPPTARSISAMIPVRGSKNLSITSGQPPTSSIVN